MRRMVARQIVLGGHAYEMRVVQMVTIHKLSTRQNLVKG